VKQHNDKDVGLQKTSRESFTIAKQLRATAYSNSKHKKTILRSTFVFKNISLTLNIMIGYGEEDERRQRVVCLRAAPQLILLRKQWAAEECVPYTISSCWSLPFLTCESRLFESCNVPERILTYGI